MRGRAKILIAIVALLLLVVAIAVSVPFVSHWRAKGVIPPSGGLYFFARFELPVASFRQSDERWAKEPLGFTEGTLGSEGCAVSSAAMILRFYGVDTDPKHLNEFLRGNGGYTERGWIYWEKAAELAAATVRFVYEDFPSNYLIDTNLLRGNPVIAKLRYPSGVTHFVVIAGKEGFDYLTQDPGAGAAKGMYPLREFGSNIEGLRIYERIPRTYAQLERRVEAR